MIKTSDTIDFFEKPLTLSFTLSMYVYTMRMFDFHWILSQCLLRKIACPNRNRTTKSTAFLFSLLTLHTIPDNQHSYRRLLSPQHRRMIVQLRRSLRCSRHSFALPVSQSRHYHKQTWSLAVSSGYRIYQTHLVFLEKTEGASIHWTKRRPKVSRVFQILNLAGLF